MKKRIFGIVMMLMLVIMSALTTEHMNAVNTTVINLNHAKADSIIKGVILYSYKRDHPQYHYLSFDHSVTKKQQMRFEQDFSSTIANSAHSWLSDHDFYYRITDTKNRQNIFTRTDDTRKPYCLDLHISYNKKGKVKISDLNYEDTYAHFNASDFIDDPFYFEGDTRFLKYYNQGEIMINQPKNITVTIMIPQRLTSTQMRDLLIEEADVMDTFLELVGICSVIILAFVLLYPIAYEKDIQPYKTMKNWYFIINALLVILPLVTGLYTMGSSYNILYYTHMSSKLDTSARYIFMMCLFMVMYFAVSLFGFGLKYIFSQGIVYYFKNHTFTAAIIRWISQTVNQLTSTPISEAADSQLIRLMVLNIIILIILAIIPVINIPLMIIYGVVLYIYIRKKVIHNKQNYLMLIDQADRLSRGEFIEVTDDLGIYNDLRDAMNHVKDGFEEAVKEEVRSTKMKTELISNVSHDLKTPLTCIKNYVILLKNAPEENRSEYLNEIEKYTNRLSLLIEDLFEVSKVNSGDVTLHKTKLDLAALVDQALVETKDLLNQNELKVIKKCNEEHAYSELDGEKTYRVFENLLSNIGKYAMGKTRVYIDIDVEDDIGITFKNISAAEMNFTPDEIVERFVRGDKSRHQSGSGLGLAIAKSFVEVQGGTFDLSIDGDMFKVILHFPKES